MIGLDTNVIVRYVAQDDVKQAAAATRLFERVLSVDRPGFVSLITLCEIARVLADCYAADKPRIRAVFEGLLSSRQILVEDTEIVWRTLRTWEGSAADFSDVLVGQISAARGCEKVVTFDKAAAKLRGFELLA
ncbi:MAG TPA: type II toxin-antitoxin system VapC family toxin [Usitatibacter sp.]|nr:type II toxin-antitoxin system VapC family toxin [Usitatibacter sp.]